MYAFFISSAIGSNYGVFDYDQRLAQTVETIESIRRKVPDAKIIVYDSSPMFLPDETLNVLSGKANYLIALQNDKNLMDASAKGMKSTAESLATYRAMTILRTDENFVSVMNKTKRIFKISGRYHLQDTFNIDDYKNTEGKYVFRKRYPSWLPKDIQEKTGADNLLVTRFYSLCSSLLDNYIEILPAIVEDTIRLGIDLEHCVYKNIDKTRLIEFDKVHCEGAIATNGSIEID